MTDAAAKKGRLHDADATRADILRVAATEFSAMGLAGAPMSNIRGITIVPTPRSCGW